MSHMPFAVCRFAVCRLPFAVCRLPLFWAAICCLLSCCLCICIKNWHGNNVGKQREQEGTGHLVRVSDVPRVPPSALSISWTEPFSCGFRLPELPCLALHSSNTAFVCQARQLRCKGLLWGRMWGRDFFRSSFEGFALNAFVHWLACKTLLICLQDSSMKNAIFIRGDKALAGKPDSQMDLEYTG